MWCRWTRGPFVFPGRPSLSFHSSSRAVMLMISRVQRLLRKGQHDVGFRTGLLNDVSLPRLNDYIITLIIWGFAISKNERVSLKTSPSVNHSQRHVGWFSYTVTQRNDWLLDHENVVCGNTDEGCYPNSQWFIKDFKESILRKQLLQV